jgi:tetratricopeptide (TPR) repeat protein
MKKTGIIIALLFICIGSFVSYRLYQKKSQVISYTPEEMIRQQANYDLVLGGNYQRAIEQYSELIKIDSIDVDLYYNRGDAFSKQGQFESAINDYKKVLELGLRDDLQTYLRLGLAEKRLGRYSDAEETFRALLKHCTVNDDNELWAGNYHLGQIQYKLGRFRKAINYYNNAVYYSKTKQNLYHRANSYYSLGIIDSAVMDYNNSIEFVKRDFISENPNSSLAKCDTCGFSIGTKEYELLTEPSSGPILREVLNKTKELKEIKQ